MQNDARSDLFLFLGAAFATAIGLFVLNKWYLSYFDVQHQAKLAEAGPYESVVAAREEDQKLLAGGKIPIDQAMQRLAQRGRQNFSAISPAPSEDLSPLSGWIRHPAYKPVVAHPIRTPRAPQPAATPTRAPEAETPPPAAPTEAVKPATPPARRRAR
jgi:hypothetical protein